MALGVFGAVAAPGQAWADDTDSSPSRTTASSSSSDSGTDSKSRTRQSKTQQPRTTTTTKTAKKPTKSTTARSNAGSATDDSGAEDNSDPVDTPDDDPETETEVPEPTETEVPEPTETEVPEPTETEVPEPEVPEPPAVLTPARDHTTDAPIKRTAPTGPAQADFTPAALTTVGVMHAPGEHEHAPATNPLQDLGKQIGTVLHLPTPAQVTQQVRAAVQTCLCNAINGLQMMFSGFGGPAAGTTDAPAGPLQNAMLMAVFAWTRRQVDYAVAAFNRSPIGQVVAQVSRAVNDWVTDVGNSPWGREISANITAFLESCNDSTGLPAELDRTVVVSGLTEPTDFEFVMDPDNPDQVHLILITEKSGSIKAFDVHTGTLSTLHRVGVVTGAGERGLIGIEVDPDFWEVGAEGYHAVYVAYTSADNYDQLSRFTLSESLTELHSEQVLVKSTQLANEFHHGGELEFDPTGQYLYWAVGNNTNPSSNSQDLTNIHGKILRLNRDGTAAEGNPFIEDDNEITRMIYAYGLRNPFRFGFDPETGALLSGDVGEGAWEELNLIIPGGNYGWPGAEGPCRGCGFVDPIYAYPHKAPTNSGSITSILVLSDDATPAGQKKVLIGDYSLGWMRELTFDSEYSSLISTRTFDSGAGAVVKLAQAPNGHIYQLNIYPGTLYVIAPSGGNRSPSAVIDASATYGTGDSLEVDFSAGGSSDPDGDPLIYRWDFGNGQTATVVNPTAVFANTAPAGGYTAYTVTLTVSDGDKQTVTTQRIVVGSTPPAADFAVTSAGGWKYNAGDTVTFEATAFDDQDGVLPGSAYSWTVEFHHADHKHPFLDNVTGPALTMTIPTDYDQLANTYYKVILNVTDSSGLTRTVVKDVRPNLVTLTFGANDPNARYTIDGVPRTGAYSEQAVVGVHRTISAISPQTVGGRQLVFDSWSDGGAQTHVIVTPGTNTSYTVNYTQSTVSSSVL